ncbi:MAG: glycosyltransferase family 4 protein [Thermoplasmata archaeon]|nr:glycosyltransferase family 4 protein [Thermoplasmata archaeon]
MRILWNNHRDSSHPRAGGAEQTIRAVGGRLATSGHEVHLLTSRAPGAPAEETVDGIQVHRFSGAVGAHLALPEQLRRLRPDVVVDDLGHVVPWMSPQLGPSPGVAFFRHLHRRTLAGQVAPWLVPPLIAVERSYPVVYRSWSFVAESGSSARDLRALGVRERSITPIPPGVDLERFTPGDRSRDPSFVFFSGMRAYKRPDHAIRALGVLRAGGLRASLDVVGAVLDDAWIRSLPEKCGVADDVRFLGRLTDADLEAVVRRAWANVNCSVSEGWGYSILESAAAGVPTAGYSVPGVRDAVGSGAIGRLAPDGDVPALARAMGELLKRSTEWRDRCRAYAEQFPWSRCAGRWEELLQRTAARTPLSDPRGDRIDFTAPPDLPDELHEATTR